MTRALLTRSLRSSQPAGRLVIIALLGVMWPVSNSWADPTNLTSRTTIGGGVNWVVSPPFDRLLLGDFADSSQSLGPLTLSGSVPLTSPIGDVRGSSTATVNSVVGASTIHATGSATATATGTPELLGFSRAFLQSGAFLNWQASFTLTELHRVESNVIEDRLALFSSAKWTEVSAAIFLIAL
jgi:hypothetical protein